MLVGNHYQISRPDVNGYAPNGYNRLATWNLPEESGKVLVNLDFATHYEQRHAGYGLGGGPGCPQLGVPNRDIQMPEQPGSLRLWRLVDGELVLMFSAPMCQLVGLEDVFVDGAGSHRLKGWIWDDNLGYTPITYTWDSTVQNYVASLLPTPTPPAQVASSVLLNPSVYSLASDALNAFEHGNYARVIENLNTSLQLESDDTLGLAQLHYIAAISFEALNRPDDALAQYVAIYEAAPDSSWGILAALHLELVP
jgi:hypothetical protein